MADEKRNLRLILAEARQALLPALAQQSSDRVQHHLIESALYADADTVVLYAPKDNEISTWLILERALADRRRVLFPKIESNDSTLSLMDVRDRQELRPGAFGLLEPAGSEMVSAAHLERALICVPGVAFSMSGQRLGRGGGYYDRLLATVPPSAITVGLAYSFQVLDRLPESPHDQRLGFIVTTFALYAARIDDAAAPDARTYQGGISKC